MAKFLITGASGFVGRHATAYFAGRGVATRLAVRSQGEIAHPDVVALGEFGAATDFAPAVKDVSGVLHLAARAHRSLNDQATEIEAYRRVNTVAAVRLAEAAAEAGVRHFVFLSTIYVHGHATNGRPIDETWPFEPTGAYAISKAAAEVQIADVARRAGMCLTIIRPVVIYGPGAKANIAALANAVRRGIPLPFGSVRNARSFLSVENLLSFVSHRLATATPGCEAFVLADDEAVSTPEFIRMIGDAVGRPARLLPFPSGLLKGLLKAGGRTAMAESLLGSLAVDTARAHSTGWKPVVGLSDGLAHAFRPPA